jgi:predicted DNA-binding antitoxin AbrB/MazE fold protein
MPAARPEDEHGDDPRGVRDGVFRPLDPVPFPEGYVTGVEIPISMLPQFADEWTAENEDRAKTAQEILARHLEWAKNRTPEDIQAARERLAVGSRPRTLPPGVTLDDVVRGTWPGDESDEQVRDALERLS